MNTYTSLIDACGKAQQLDHAFSLLEHMQSLGVMPNGATYSTLINVCARCGEVDRALAILEQMAAANTTPDTLA